MNSSATNRLISLFIFTAVPIAGIFLWGWDWRQILILYWLGNITHGLVFFIAMAKTPVDVLAQTTLKSKRGLPVTTNFGKYASILFLMFHYGIFTSVHGVFVFAITGGIFQFGIPTEAPVSINPLVIIVPWLVATVVQGIVAIVKPVDLAHPPSVARLYVRIIALHIGILGGGFLIAYLQLPAASALLLIALHTLFETSDVIRQRVFSERE